MEMPTGFKLEEQVIVPSNSKMQVQVTNWNPGSQTMKTEAENYIAQAVKDGIIQASHLKDLQSGAMTADRLIGLYITIQQRRSK
ncbi:hypothetical protein [Lysinibacillus sphaericus]|uniref:hypothetical protein n=1 Tax=Lysinibacillus sphaericus TaxID=1421 RepID=UPI0021054100|nr:hypothetical protein [Lysinibacillus sp. SDF0037]